MKKSKVLYLIRTEESIKHAKEEASFPDLDIEYMTFDKFIEKYESLDYNDLLNLEGILLEYCSEFDDLKIIEVVDIFSDLTDIQVTRMLSNFEETSYLPKTTLDKLEQVKEFVRVNGHCLIDTKRNTLGAWCSKMRVLNNKGTLDKRIFKVLDDLGYPWNPIGESWGKALDELKKDLKKGKLSEKSRNFINNNKRKYKIGKLSLERFNMITKIYPDFVKTKRVNKSAISNDEIAEIVLKFVESYGKIPKTIEKSYDIYIGKWIRNLKYGNITIIEEESVNRLKENDIINKFLNKKGR